MLRHTPLLALLLVAVWFVAPTSASVAQPTDPQTSRPSGPVEVNAGAEVALLAMANGERADHHLRLLKMSLALRELARGHSFDMARRGYVGHDSPYDGSFLDRLASALPPGTWVGENVAAVQTVEQAHAVFLASALHLRNILDPNFHNAGIGIVSAGDVMIVTEDFAQ